MSWLIPSFFTTSNDANMSKDAGKAQYFLVPASSGLCIQPGVNKTVTSPFKDDDEEQRWSIETGKKNKVAFRNVGSGSYLRASGGYKSNAVKLGQRQWWTLETSNTPHAFWIKCDEFPNAYLCNAYGNIKADNTIYMWAKEEYWTQTMLWYIFDFESWEQHKGSKPDVKALSSGSQPNGANDSDEKVKEAEEKQQEMEKKLKAAEEKQLELEKELKAADETQQQLEAEKKTRQEVNEKKEDELKAKEGDLAAKLEAAAKREKELDDRERTLDEQGNASSGDRATPSGHSDSSEEVKSLRDRLSKLQDEMKETEGIQDKLNEKDIELAKLKRAYEELKQSKEANKSRSNGSRSDGRGIVGRRLFSDSKEMDAARVGARNRPLGFTSDLSRPAKARGTPIMVQREFTMLPRFQK